MGINTTEDFQIYSECEGEVVMIDTMPDYESAAEFVAAEVDAWEEAMQPVPTMAIVAPGETIPTEMD